MLRTSQTIMEVEEGFPIMGLFMLPLGMALLGYGISVIIVHPNARVAIPVIFVALVPLAAGYLAVAFKPAVVIDLEKQLVVVHRVRSRSFSQPYNAVRVRWCLPEYAPISCRPLSVYVCCVRAVLAEAPCRGAHGLSRPGTHYQLLHRHNTASMEKSSESARVRHSCGCV